MTDKDRKLIEDIWNVIFYLWMSHHQWKKHKFKVNGVRYKEPKYQCETPSGYIIRKLELIGLVHDYTLSEVIQSIMEGLPDFWTTHLNMRFIDATVEFWNAIKYHEEIPICLNPPATSPTTLPNQAYSSKHLLANQAHSNKCLLPNWAYPSNCSWATLLNAQFIDSIVEIQNVNICNKEILIHFSLQATSLTTFPDQAYFNY
jgi:hypothetical protein